MVAWEWLPLGARHQAPGTNPLALWDSVTLEKLTKASLTHLFSWNTMPFGLICWDHDFARLWTRRGCLRISEPMSCCPWSAVLADRGRFLSCEPKSSCQERRPREPDGATRNHRDIGSHARGSNEVFPWCRFHQSLARVTEFAMVLRTLR